MSMKQKHLKYVYKQDHALESPQRHFQNNPVKSPSPDKKRANIITPTKSPQMMEIKRNMTPSRILDKRFQRSTIQLKPFEQLTQYYTNDDFQEYKSTQKKNQMLEQTDNVMPQQFTITNSQVKYHRQKHRSSNQLDYIRLLQQKQRTIKQLHQIIEMINKNNSLDLSNSQIFGNLTASQNKRHLNSSHKTVFSNKSNDLSGEKQMKNQVRILTIQNQKLIHMIQKLNLQQGQVEQSQSNLRKDKTDINAYRMKQQTPSRQIHSMRESLLQKDEQNQSLLKQNKEVCNKYIQLEQENQRLIRMMKDREMSDRKYHSSLIESNISQKSNLHDSQAKEKLSLVKIKQQYNQSLKVFKDTVYQDVDQFIREAQINIRGLQNRLEQMDTQVQTLEKFRFDNQNSKNRTTKFESQITQRPLLKQQVYRRVYQDTRREQLQDISEIQIPSTQRHRQRQIQSLLMEKNENYQRQLQSEREAKQSISSQFSELKARYNELQGRYNRLIEQNTQPTLRPKPQMSISRHKNIEQIQDINSAKAKQVQLQRLRELILTYQVQFQEQKRKLLEEIQNLNSKHSSYRRNVEAQRQQAQQKEMNAETRMVGKQQELIRNSSKYQSEIDYLRDLVSEKQLPAQDPVARDEIEKMRHILPCKQKQIQERDVQIHALQSHNQQLQQSQLRTRQQVKKLISNYQAQLSILKTKIQRDSHNHQQQLGQGKRQVNRLIQQSLNSQRMMISSEAALKEEMNRLQEKLQEAERQLMSRNRESRELLGERDNLRAEHSEMKENLEQLLNIANRVEQMQDQNQAYKQKTTRLQSQISQLSGTIQVQSHTIHEQQGNNQGLRLKIRQLKAQLQNLNQVRKQLEQLQSKVIMVRKQSQDIISHKDIQFTVEVQKYQQQKAQYEFIVKQLKDQSQCLKQQIEMLRQQNIRQQESYNQILQLRESSLLRQLYQLRTLVSKNTTHMSYQSGDTQFNYDLGKLYIEFEAKIQQNRQLQANIHELGGQLKKSMQQKHLMDQKISFLQKNISIYEGQLKQRKIFCEKLITQKTKLEKELLLIKRLKLESKAEESERVRESLIQRVNNLVKLEENRENQVKKVIEKRSESPIKKINTFISRVQEFHRFVPRKVQQ